jgi:hypothetical protein
VPLLNWLFRNRQTGAITIGQFPNTPLWIFLGALVVRRVTGPSGWPGAGLRVVSTASLGWWAADEVIRGVNPWRRLLGVGGCAAVVASAYGLVT